MTVGAPLPWHSRYSPRPSPMSTTPAKSPLLPAKVGKFGVAGGVGSGADADSGMPHPYRPADSMIPAVQPTSHKRSTASNDHLDHKHRQGSAVKGDARDTAADHLHMTGAWIGADPRGLVNDNASGHGFDLSPRVRATPFAAFGSTAPSSSGTASLRDMAAFVRMQLRQGLSAGGPRRVRREPHPVLQPGVSVPVAETFDPDATSKNYAMGWFREEFKDGSTLLHHGGNVDGFSLFIGLSAAARPGAGRAEQHGHAAGSETRTS